MNADTVGVSPINPRTNKPMHPNSLKNLKPPWQPGTNGYNAGRLSLTERLRHWLDKPLVKPAPDAKAVDWVVYSTIKGAIDREPSPFNQLWDRVDGKVVEQRRNLIKIEFEVIEEQPRRIAPADVVDAVETRYIAEVAGAVEEPRDAAERVSSPAEEKTGDNVSTATGTGVTPDEYGDYLKRELGKYEGKS